MPKDSLTPDELGEMLQKGEITKEEAIEVMAQRARQEAFKNLYSAPKPLTPEEADEIGADASASTRPSPDRKPWYKFWGD